MRLKVGFMFGLGIIIIVIIFSYDKVIASPPPTPGTVSIIPKIVNIEITPVIAEKIKIKPYYFSKYSLESEGSKIQIEWTDKDEAPDGIELYFTDSNSVAVEAIGSKIINYGLYCWDFPRMGNYYYLCDANKKNTQYSKKEYQYPLVFNLEEIGGLAGLDEKAINKEGKFPDKIVLLGRLNGQDNFEITLSIENKQFVKTMDGQEEEIKGRIGDLKALIIGLKFSWSLNIIAKLMIVGLGLAGASIIVVSIFLSKKVIRKIKDKRRKIIMNPAQESIIPTDDEESMYSQEPVAGPTRENPDFKKEDSYMHRKYNERSEGENEQN